MMSGLKFLMSQGASLFQIAKNTNSGECSVGKQNKNFSFYVILSMDVISLHLKCKPMLPH